MLWVLKSKRLFVATLLEIAEEMRCYQSEQVDNTKASSPFLGDLAIWNALMLGLLNTQHQNLEIIQGSQAGRQWHLSQQLTLTKI